MMLVDEDSKPYTFIDPNYLWNKTIKKFKIN